VMGPFEFHALKVESSTEITGPTTKSENGTAGSLNIIGPSTAENIICKKFEVVGPVEETKLTVSGETDIAGSLKAEESTFEDLTLLTNESSLKDVKVKNISIKKNDKDKEKKQILRLQGSTFIKGNIIFESGKGIVELGPDVKIQGTIKGATVEEN